MRFDVLTLFPEMILAAVSQSIIGRAVKGGLIQINAVDIRDFSENKHKKTDDYPYGGGSGMVMSAQPIVDAFDSLIRDLSVRPKCIYLSPQGAVLTQEMAASLKDEGHLILLCGHYEGIDERVLEEIVDMEISIGDYVLTGGELPALVLMDTISRLVPGVLSGEEAYQGESHYNGLLEYPQYTRPSDFRGRKVPDILMSGHHANIEKWRLDQSILRTKLKRPDLYEKYKSRMKPV